MQIKNYKYVVLALLAIITSEAYATGAGFYAGAQMGESYLRNKQKQVQTGGTPPFVLSNPSNNGFGGRLFLGYAANPYLAVEGGWTYYSPSKYNTNVFPACGNPQIRENTIDLVGKGMLPFSTSGFGVFAKGGVALARMSTAGRLSGQTINSCSGSTADTSLRPVAGVGISYDATQNWVVDLSYTRVFGSGNFAPADLLAFGVSYHVVDKMCGQFIC